MKPVQETTTINFDNVTIEVTKLPLETQQLVAFYDDWRQKEVDLSSELVMVRSALRDLQTQLTQKLQADRDETLKKAEALGIVPQATEAKAATTEGNKNEAS